MDKAILKKFAIESRQDLMKKMESKIKLFYVDEKFDKNQNGDIIVLSNKDHILSLAKEEYAKRLTLIERIKELGLEQVIEESAYTWFNRIVAIRYMEIHDYLPLTKDNQSLGIRVLSSKDNTPDPEILKFTNLANPDLDIDFNKEKFVELKTDNEKFKYVLLLVCKKLSKVIPQVFDGVTDYIDILMPDNLLNDTGFVNKIVKEIPEDNFNEVEIIGWLYQYYNQTEKDRVISAKKAYKKNEIPYATQLFTPDWIVKYMVENSLGRYWIEHGGDMKLIENWKYFIKDNVEENEDKILPTEIKCIDPCCGSGHILVYMFEVLYQIYESEGYNKSEIAELILKNNLYGLDIDDRAGQLSILSVLLKARKYDKNIFDNELVRNLNVMSIQESTNTDSIAKNVNLSEESKKLLNYLNTTFKDAKEIGSLLIVVNNDYTKLQNELGNNDTIFNLELKKKVIPLIKQANILSGKYDIVVANPPYINRSQMSSATKKYINEKFKDSNIDLFSAFVEKNIQISKDTSYLGYLTPNVWMFISSYETLRKKICESYTISSLIQLGKGSFFNEATVDLVTFVIKKEKANNDGIYFRLFEEKGDMEIQKKKFLTFKNEKKYYKVSNNKFTNIPEYIIGYWVNDKIIEAFKTGTLLKNIAAPRQGLATTNNDLFVRNWFEIDKNEIFRSCNNQDDSKKSTLKWYPYNKGGLFRKWYGNQDYVINWKNNGNDIKYYIRNKNPNVARGEKFYFKESISWSKISSGKIAFRYFPKGFIFDVAGCSVFVDKDIFSFIFCFLNSNVSEEILKCISPTLNYEAGQIQILPIINNKKYLSKINNLTYENISLSKKDWDSFETSWDFEEHPLIRWKSIEPDYVDAIPKYKIQLSYEECKSNANAEFEVLKKNEEELNRIFIDIYGLQDELTPEESDKDVTIHKIFDNKEDIPDEMKNSQYALTKLDVIKSFISYAVGCMLGRYSLDEKGLAYAGGEFDFSKYKTFEADKDNIIPITENKYFEDDIVTKFVKFVEVVYGKNTLEENIDFIANTLGKRTAETSRDTIRRYFLNDFYTDHVKMYQKRPIYWLFDSGKKNGFKALIYMHRYNDQTVSKIRLDYLHKMQHTYETELKDVEYKLSGELTLNEKKELTKKQADLNAKLQETNEYDEKIAHIADQRISIDLDDGVAYNYAKFSVKNPKTGKDESILANSKDIVKKTKNSKEE